MSKIEIMGRLMFCLLSFMAGSLTGQAQDLYQEPFRPQIHFSPKTGWMNDPNGMVCHQQRSDALETGSHCPVSG
jgi:sucrose-6-phosphate hydrolase SacC (GH32 family)